MGPRLSCRNVVSYVSWYPISINTCRAQSTSQTKIDRAVNSASAVDIAVAVGNLEIQVIGDLSHFTKIPEGECQLDASLAHYASLQAIKLSYRISNSTVFRSPNVL